VVFEDEVGDNADRSQFLILGGAIFALALLTMLIAALSGVGFGLSFGVAGFYVLLAVVLGLFGWKSGADKRAGNLGAIAKEPINNPRAITKPTEPAEDGI